VKVVFDTNVFIAAFFTDGLCAGLCEDVVRPSQQVTGICRDEDDNNILACGLAAKADYLVTGDKGLFEVQQFQGITIISPRDFELIFIELVG
jgi:predicted nucleic acid-binding protein